MADEIQDVAGRPAGRWSAVLSWPLLVLLGWLLFELTAQPGLGAAVLCVKFGWNDFRTAWWLRRRDPWPARGRACFWTYLASGCGKVVLTAFLVMIVCVLLTPGRPGPGKQGAPANVPPPELLAAVFTGLVGGLLMVLTTTWALWLAWRHGVRVWLGGAVHQARRWDIWPPSQVSHQPGNGAGCLIQCVLVVLLLILIMLLILAVAFAPLGPNQNTKALVAIGGLMLAMIGGSAAILYLGDVLNKHVLAGRPEECWPADEDRAPTPAEDYFPLERSVPRGPES
jgi:hypothetical protein